MPFGLRNAPGTFQRAIDVILAQVRWQYSLVYLDDIVVFSKTGEEHIDHVRSVLSLLADAGVTLKLKKCFFFTDKIDYLGHVIRPGKLQIAEHTTDAIRQLQAPTNLTELRSFLGLCNVFRRFVPNFARIAAPLNRKLRKGEPTVFGPLNEEEMGALEELKKRLIEPPILTLPRRDGRYTVDTDACDKQVGCVLLQEQPEVPARPIGYWSRSLNQAERAYDTTHRECLAVVWAVLLLRPYLEGTRYTIRTDHDALRWILNMADATGKLARWRLRLAEYEFDVVHRAGVKHQAADALSRLPTDGEDKAPLDDEIPVLVIQHDDEQTVSTVVCVHEQYETTDGPAIELPDGALTLDALIRAQKTDTFCKRIADTVDTPGSAFNYDRDGVLVRRSALDGSVQRVIPVAFRTHVLQLMHAIPLAGHPGARRMYDTMRCEFYWPHMANDVYETVQRCESCAATRGTQYTKQKHLRLFPANGPLEFVAMDILGPLPKTKQGNQFVVVLTDRYSKLTRAIPTGKTTATTVATIFVDHWVIPYGIPNYVLTDNGPQFVAKFFASVCLALGVKHVTTTAYHPRTNGQTERFNRTIVTRLRHYVGEHQDDWDLYVQLLTYAYNAQVHRSTRTTPYSLVLTRHPPGPATVGGTTALATDASTEPEAATLRHRLLSRLRALVGRTDDHLRTAQDGYKRYFDRTVRVTPMLAAGDMVYVDRGAPPRTAAEEMAGAARTSCCRKPLDRIVYWTQQPTPSPSMRMVSPTPCQSTAYPEVQVLRRKHTSPKKRPT